MRRPGAAAVVAVEEFVERNVVAVIGIRLQLRLLAQDRAVACGVFQEQPREAVRQFVGDLKIVYEYTAMDSTKHVENTMAAVEKLNAEKKGS